MVSPRQSLELTVYKSITEVLGVSIPLEGVATILADDDGAGGE